MFDNSGFTLVAREQRTIDKAPKLWAQNEENEKIKECG